MDAKLKYLQFIQDVITRMNSNSFVIKAWTVTIISALFALAAKDADQRYVYITWFAILVFWMLDGFYLSQERLYRGLYDHARQLPVDEVNFDMNATPYQAGRTSWLASTFSRTLTLFYLALFIISLIVAYIMSL